jgi:hypothetical protein
MHNSDAPHGLVMLINVRLNTIKNKMIKHHGHVGGGWRCLLLFDFKAVGSILKRYCIFARFLCNIGGLGVH